MIFCWILIYLYLNEWSTRHQIFLHAVDFLHAIWRFPVDLLKQIIFGKLVSYNSEWIEDGEDSVLGAAASCEIVPWHVGALIKRFSDITATMALIRRGSNQISAAKKIKKDPKRGTGDVLWVCSFGNHQVIKWNGPNGHDILKTKQYC